METRGLDVFRDSTPAIASFFSTILPSFLIDQSSIVCLKKFVPVEKNVIKFCVDRDRIEL